MLPTHKAFADERNNFYVLFGGFVHEHHGFTTEKPGQTDHCNRQRGSKEENGSPWYRHFQVEPFCDLCYFFRGNLISIESYCFKKKSSNSKQHRKKEIKL